MVFASTLSPYYMDRVTPKQLKQLREEMILTKNGFARLIGVSSRTIARAEAGKRVSKILYSYIVLARSQGKIADAPWHNVFGQK